MLYGKGAKCLVVDDGKSVKESVKNGANEVKLLNEIVLYLGLFLFVRARLGGRGEKAKVSFT